MSPSDTEPTANRRFPDLTRRSFVRATGAGVGALLISSLGTSGARELVLAEPTGQSAFSGRVADLLTGWPIPGATVRAEPSGAATTADRAGVYRLNLPPGVYGLSARHPAYVDLALVECRLAPGAVSAVNFDLVRPGLSREEEEAVYAKLGLQVESPLPDSQMVAAASQAQTLSLPQTIVVRHEEPSGVYTDTPVPLEDYVKGVVPNEVPYTWPAEALKAQAVAARSYGVVSFLAYGYVWDDTRSQVYDPSKRTAQTDAAVDATRSVVVTYGGTIAQTFFFAQCNSATTRDSERALSWQRCEVRGWNYAAYCRARQCGGHNPYNNGCTGEYYGYRGHGVGMCQFGAKARSDEGLAYQDILKRYYTDVAVQAIGAPPTPTLLSPGNGALFAPGEVVALSWSAVGARYNVEVGGVVRNDVQSPPLEVTAGSVGTYPWCVQAIGADGLASDWSPKWTFRVVSQVFRSYLPVVVK